MSVERESADQEQSDKGVVLSPEVLAGQDRLINKTKVQERVMIKLRFVPTSFDVNNFDRSNHELQPNQETRARSWGAVENKNGETRSDVFKQIYEAEIAKYPVLILSDSQVEEMAERIASLMQARESEWS